MSGNQLWLTQPDGQYIPGCTVYAETRHHYSDVVNFFIQKEVNLYQFTVAVRLSRVRVRVKVSLVIGLA